MGWDFTLGFLPYNDEWRRQRRLFHENFRAKAALAYQPLEVERAHALLKNLTQSPKDAFTHIRKLFFHFPTPCNILMLAPWIPQFCGIPCVADGLWLSNGT
jgi:cytochrome P450